MDEEIASQAKIEKPYAFFAEPGEVVTDPGLSRAEKVQALDSLEQDSRQMAVASAEGMSGGEPNKLQEVLDAQDALDLPPSAYAYRVVSHDLRDRLTGALPRDERAAIELAYTALTALEKTSLLASATTTPDPVTEIEDEIAREKLDP